jgi:hypothetical protein
MSYYCTRCEKNVDYCKHKTNIETEFYRAKAVQMERLVKYWEDKYNNLKNKVRECIICRNDEEQ